MRALLIGASVSVAFVVAMTAAIARAVVHVLEDDVPLYDADDLDW
jgi:hypothetical protein